MLHLTALLAALTVSFVQLADGAAIQDFGHGAYADLDSTSSSVVVTAIGVRVTSDGSQAPVALQAYLDDPLPGVIVRLDGVQLSSMPLTFANVVPLNLVTRHRLQIDYGHATNTMHPVVDIHLELGAVQE